MIENTSQRIPALHLLGTMSEGSDSYIENMEAQGQRELVGSTDLPSECNFGTDADFKALGFTFGEPHPHDPMFRPATLPDGWRKDGSDHAMWSYILDEKGRKRVSIFYKAAFYDRRSFMNLVEPTEALGNLYYADEPPTSIRVDELLTADVAREWIANRREHDVKYRDLFVSRGEDETAARYVATLARLDAMEALLPDA